MGKLHNYDVLDKQQFVGFPQRVCNKKKKACQPNSSGMWAEFWPEKQRKEKTDKHKKLTLLTFACIFYQTI